VKLWVGAVVAYFNHFPRNLNSLLIPLEAWMCVRVLEALRRADPTSKRSYQLSKRFI